MDANGSKYGFNENLDNFKKFFSLFNGLFKINEALTFIIQNLKARQNVQNTIEFEFQNDVWRKGLVQRF